MCEIAKKNGLLANIGVSQIPEESSEQFSLSQAVYNYIIYLYLSRESVSIYLVTVLFSYLFLSHRHFQH